MKAVKLQVLPQTLRVKGRQQLKIDHTLCTAPSLFSHLPDTRFEANQTETLNWRLVYNSFVFGRLKNAIVSFVGFLGNIAGLKRQHRYQPSRFFPDSYSKLLGFWSLCIGRCCEEQRFGNWVSLRHHVKGWETPTHPFARGRKQIQFPKHYAMRCVG
jgi:hypothetical protein